MVSPTYVWNVDRSVIAILVLLVPKRNILYKLDIALEYDLMLSLACINDKKTASSLVFIIIDGIASYMLAIQRFTLDATAKEMLKHLFVQSITLYPLHHLVIRLFNDVIERIKQPLE